MGPFYWAGDAMALYREQLGQLPDYVADLEDADRRIYPEGGKFQQEVLKTQDAKYRKYNAFEKDIAVLNIYFGKATVTGENIRKGINNFWQFLISEYQTNKRMTVWDLISNIGGLLGVYAGVSLLSCAEIIYWLLLKTITHWSNA